jgi:ABC-type Fe3+-hydroxamate transport system substrate-binding protein
MKKRLFLFTILLTFLLAACGGEVEITEAVEVANTPTALSAPAATVESVATAVTVETGENTVPAPMTTLGNGCTLTSSEPEAPAEYVELFGEYVELFGVTENDWVKGPETAALTIVEYGDYQ